MLFHYKIDEMLYELNSCVYQLAYGNTLFLLKLQSLLTMLSEDLLYCIC